MTITIVPFTEDEEMDIRKELGSMHGVEVTDSLDMVNNPPHYNKGDIECIDAMKAQTTDEEFRGHCKMCAVKYIWRERDKGGDESLRKAIWYLQKALEK